MILLTDRYSPTPPSWLEAEAALLRDGQLALWTGRAGTALYYAYRAAQRKRPDVTQPEIIMPAVMCATAANVAYSAGCMPRFADVDPQTGLLTLESVQERWNDKTVAVVAIHLFGATVAMPELAAWCAAQDVTLIEDPTHAPLGHFPSGQAVGTYGAFSIYSFGSSKFLGTGNGMLTARTVDAAAQLEATITSTLPPPQLDAHTQQQLALSYRNLHHSFVTLMRMRKLASAQLSEAFLATRSAYDPLYLRPANPEAPIGERWHDLEADLETRLQKARRYATLLHDGPWQLLTGYEQSGSCWRFTLLLEPDVAIKQTALSEAVRRDGFHVSNLYWPVDQFFNPDDACPNADSFGRRVLNLWVDAGVNLEYVEACSASLLRHAR